MIEKPVQVTVEIPRYVIEEKIVEIVVHKPVEVIVEKQVEVVVEREKIVQVPQHCIRKKCRKGRKKEKRATIKPMGPV